MAEGTDQTYNFIGVADSVPPDLPPCQRAGKNRQAFEDSRPGTWTASPIPAKDGGDHDGDGTLLDHWIFMYGSNMGNSDKHSNWPIPTVIVGGGNGKMKQGGQHIDLAQQTPQRMCT